MLVGVCVCVGGGVARNKIIWVMGRHCTIKVLWVGGNLEIGIMIRGWGGVHKTLSRRLQDVIMSSPYQKCLFFTKYNPHWRTPADFYPRRQQSGGGIAFSLVCLSVCLSVCLFVCLSVCLFVCLSVCGSAAGKLALLSNRTQSCKLSNAGPG